MRRCSIILLIEIFLISGCDNPPDSGLFALCRDQFKINYSIEINKSTGQGKFEDIIGPITTCRNSHKCLSFPIEIDLNKLRYDGPKNLMPKPGEFDGQYTYKHGDASWRYIFDKNNIEEISLDSNSDGRYTNYIRCRGNFDISIDL
jgi:hypothetical protein